MRYGEKPAARLNILDKGSKRSLVMNLLRVAALIATTATTTAAASV